MKVFLKVLFFIRGIILLWERRRVLYVWSRTGGSIDYEARGEGLWRISAKSLESAASQSSIIVGWVGDSRPCFFIFVSIPRFYHKPIRIHQSGSTNPDPPIRIHQSWFTDPAPPIRIHQSGSHIFGTSLWSIFHPPIKFNIGNHQSGSTN